MEPAQLMVEIERHHLAGYGWALSCCSRNHDEAQDVLQTVYLKILQGRARYNGRAAFKTWLFAVIRRTAADERRRWFFRRIKLLAYKLDAQAESSHPDFSLPHDSSALEEFCKQALGKLPRRQREVLQLVFYHDHSLAEAAEIMGVGLGSARTHYERGKRRIREWMSKAEMTDEYEWIGKRDPTTVS
ncbi:MAG: RNA polymerase sigma factor [Kiritimatiellia bacterium]|nr:RNA polymerase sigma factor [Kiritimatiellia bacterium]